MTYDSNSADTCPVEFDAVKAIVEGLAGAEVVEQFTGSARGWSDGQKMAVSSMSNNTDKVKTLVHEFAHHTLHTGSAYARDKSAKLSRETLEVEAESVAHLVMSYMGLDFELSQAYVSAYGAGIADARTGLIVKTADKVIRELRKAGE